MSLRVFVASEYLPRPDHSGGDRRFFALLEMLARRHRVDLWVENDWKNLPAEQVKKYIDNLNLAHVQLLSPDWKGFAGALARTQYDLGFFEFYFMATRHAAEFRRRQPGAKVIVDSVDVHFARELSGVESGLIDLAQAEKTRQEELAAYRTADAVIVITDEDERILRAEGAMPPLFLLPIIMSTVERSLKHRDPELLFIAGFNHPPNLDGLKWFVKEVWPEVHKRAPEASLTIIGSNTPHEVMSLNATQAIHVAGFVEDTSPYLDRAAISIAPLRYGGGMKGKVVEAMSHGLPVVTTAIGAQGINAVSGDHLLIAETSTEFARGVTDLLNDPERCRRIGLAGQRHIANLCSPERVDGALEEMLRTTVSHKRLVTDWFRWRTYHAKIALRMAGRQLLAARQRFR